MKAEERKELETNILADKLGRMVKGAKTGPSRRGIFIVIGIILLALVAIVFLRLRSTEGTANSKRWKDFLIGDHRGFSTSSEQHKLSRLQEAHRNLWQEGVAKLLLPNNFKTALASIRDAESKYIDSVNAFKNDPLLAGEANYQLGIIQELLTLEDVAAVDANLKQAVVFYDKAAKAWKPDSPLGKMAKDRGMALQFAVTDDTLSELKKEVDKEKIPVSNSWTDEQKKKHEREQQAIQDDLDTVTKSLKPLLNKTFETSNSLREAVEEALSKGDMEKDARVRWQAKVVELAQKRRQAAANVYRHIAFWSSHPLPPMQNFGNPHFGMPGFGAPNFGMPN